MSDEVARSVQNAAIQANLQMNDLGDVNRNRVFTVDPGYRMANRRHLYAGRDCNDETTPEHGAARANKTVTSVWNNPLRFIDPDADDDDGLIDGTPVDGQSHRAKLNADKRAGNLQEDIDTRTHPTYRRPPLSNRGPLQSHRGSVPSTTGPPPSNRRPTSLNRGLTLSERGCQPNGTHHTNVTDSISNRKQPGRPQDMPRNHNNSPGPASHNTRDQLVNRSYLQSKSASAAPKPKVLPQSPQPTRNKAIPSKGESSTTRAPTDRLNGRLTPQVCYLSQSCSTNINSPTPEPDLKKRRIARVPPPVAESENKRQFKSFSEPSEKQNDQQASTQKRSPSRAVEAGTHLGASKVAGKAQASARGSKQTAPVKLVELPSNIHPHWNAPLGKNKVVIPPFKLPAALSTEAEIRESPTTAHLFNPEESKQPAIRSNGVTSTVTPYEPASKVQDIMDATEDNHKEMKQLSVSFEAMQITSTPSIPAAKKPGLAASKYATTLSPAGSVVSTISTVSQIKHVDERPLSSEDAFWKWKAAQKPNRDGF